MKSQKTQEKGLGDLSRTVLTRTDINHLIDKGNESSILLEPTALAFFHVLKLTSLYGVQCRKGDGPKFTA